MKDRLITLAGALAALIVVAGMFTGGAQNTQSNSLPASSDRDERGYYAARQWLDRQGFRTLALNNRYPGLPELNAPRRGNLLVIPYPQIMPIRPRERDALASWTGGGNTVLLAFHDRAWFGKNDILFESLGIGISEQEPPEKGEDGIDVDLEPQIQPVTEHPLLTGVKRIEAGPEFDIHAKPRLEWTDASGDPVTLLKDLSSEQPVLAAAVGNGGRIWLLRHGEIFSNHSIGRADNARLWMNMVSLSLEADGAVIFDDMHQGDSALYDPEAFYNDRRLYISLGFLLLIWLLWLLGYSNRVITPRHDQHSPSQSDYVRAVGRFYARRMREPDAALELFSHFFNNLRKRHRLAVDGTACWNLLEPQRAPRVSRQDVGRLQRLYSAALAQDDVDLQELHNLTRKIKESMHHE